MKPNTTVQKKSLDDSPSSCSNCSQNRFCLPRNLKSDQKKFFESIISSEKINKGNYLYTQASTKASLYIIKSGSIKTYISNQSGSEQILGFHCPGDLTGFDSFSSSKHTCTAQALDDTFICKLDFHKLEILYEQIPPMRHEIMQHVGNLLHQNHLMMFSLGKMQSEERFANFLIHISERNITRDLCGRKLNLCMTRGDLANYLGIAIETLSRTLSQFQSKKVIKVKRRAVEILNIQALRDIAYNLRF